VITEGEIMQGKFFVFCVIVWIIAIINFFSFILFTLSLGGDALNGFQENGKYYVSTHGRNTEVSEVIWKMNRIHAISMIFTHLLAIICGLIYWKKYNKMNK